MFPIVIYQLLFHLLQCNVQILVDDSSEKCVRNPAHTSIQPRPYEPYGSPVRFSAASAPLTAASNFDSAELDIDELTQPAKEGNSVTANVMEGAVAASAIAVSGSELVTVAPLTSESASSEAVVGSILQPTVLIGEVVERESTVASGGMTRGANEDKELKPDEPLWAYLDRIAQYDGSNKDLYDLYGAYIC